MTMFLSRSAWGALPANRESADRAETSIVFVHHDAVALPRDENDVQLQLTVEQAKARLQSIQRDHLSRMILDQNGNPILDQNGNPIYWADAAYNLNIAPGLILETRGWDKKGGGTGRGNKVAHYSGSWDTVSVSICVMGNYKIDVLDDATRTSLVAALAECRARYGDALAIMGDRDVNSTNCPGDNLYPLLNELWVQSSLLENDDMPSADEVAKAILDELVPSHDYTTGTNSDIPLRVALSNIGSELSLIRHHLTGVAPK